jgi:hypothetical protein
VDFFTLEGGLIGFPKPRYGSIGVSGQPIGLIFKGKETSVLSSRIKEIFDFFTLKDGPIGFPETSVRNFRYTLSNIAEELRSHKTLMFVLLITGKVTVFVLRNIPAKTDTDRQTDRQIDRQTVTCIAT